MGNYKTVNRNVDNTKLPRMYPEPKYQVKTRPPTRKNSWRVNILLRIRQQQLSDEAMPLARRKCYDPIMEYNECLKQQGGFWFVFNCQQHFFYVSECLEHEFNVEMDKRRRNMKRNPESWWKQLYNENGQVGKQVQMPKEQYSFMQSWKQILFGQDQTKNINPISAQTQN